jgi:hypothetical protein
MSNSITKMGCLGTKLWEYGEACAHATHDECTHSTNKLLLEENSNYT